MAIVVSQACFVRLIWSKGGSDYAINVLAGTGLAPASVNQAVANTLGAAIKARLTSSTFVGMMNNTIALNKVGLRSIGAPGQPEYLDAGTAVVGSSANFLLPPQVALCVTLRTALVGKANRGRVYLPGFHATTSQVDGTATATAVNAALAFIDGMRADFTASGLTLAVLSRKELAAKPVTLVQVRNNVFDTIRGRANPGV
jgi:hypothetical protein